MDSYSLSLKLPAEQVELIDFANKCKVYIKRDDLIHPILSGNKYRKLSGFLKYYYTNNFSEIVTVGSAHSNYIHAISYLAYELKIPIKIFIYGYHDQRLSCVLNDLQKWNISWEKIDRSKLAKLQDQYHDTEILFISEGANNELADYGIVQLLKEIDIDNSLTSILMACGTGASIQSILRNTDHLNVLSYSPVQSMKETIKHDRLIWLNESLFIPFAGFSEELLEFIVWFYSSYQILLDPIYTSRLLYEFQKNSHKIIAREKIIFIHTGGIQAWRDYRNRYPQLENKLKKILDFELQKISS